jgi:hypothetical protein
MLLDNSVGGGGIARSVSRVEFALATVLGHALPVRVAAQRVVESLLNNPRGLLRLTPIVAFKGMEGDVCEEGTRVQVRDRVRRRPVAL